MNMDKSVQTDLSPDRFLEPPYLIPSSHDYENFYSFIEEHAEIFKTCPFLSMKGPPSKAKLPNTSIKAAKTHYKLKSVDLSTGWFYNDVQLMSETEFEFQIAKKNVKFESDPIAEEDLFWDSLKNGQSTYYPNDVKFNFPPSPLCNLTKIQSTLSEIIPHADRLEGIGNSLAYFGFPGTYFTLHTEDYDLCSVSYLHKGAPKYWYGFLAQDTERIKQVLRKIYPDSFRECPQAQRHKSFLIDPRKIREYLPDLKIWRVVQNPGDYVVTGPNVFHEGFNSGYNVAEAVNFGIQAWLKYFKNASCCFCLDASWKDNALARSIKVYEGGDNDESGHRSFLINRQDKLIDTSKYGNTRTTYYLIITTLLNFHSIQKGYSTAEISMMPKSNPFYYGTYAMQVFHCQNAKKRIISPNRIHQYCKQHLGGCLVVPYLEEAMKDADNYILLPNNKKANKNFSQALKLKYSIFREICNSFNWSVTLAIFDRHFLEETPKVNSRAKLCLPLSDDVEDEDEERYYSLAFCENHASEVYCCLSDSAGVCLIRSNFSKNRTSRRNFWSKTLLPLLEESIQLIIPSLGLLETIFQCKLETFDDSFHEFVPEATDVDDASVEIFKKLQTRFPYIEAFKLKVEDLARLQVLFYKKTLSPAELSYIASLSPTIESNIYALNLAPAVQKEKPWKLCVIDEFGQSQGIIEKFCSLTKTNLKKEIEAFQENLLLQKDDILLCPEEYKKFIEEQPNIQFINQNQKKNKKNLKKEEKMMLQAHEMISDVESTLPKKKLKNK